MPHEPKEPREFSCFDDFNNDGWGNEILEPRPSIPEQDFEDDQDFPIEKENTVRVENKNNGEMNCTNE